LKHPDSVVRDAGESVGFFVQATGEGTLSYQWEYSTVTGEFAPIVDDDRVFGSETATLEIVNLVPADIGFYRCQVSNEFGTTPSTPGALSVIQFVSPYISATPLEINVSAVQGENADPAVITVVKAGGFGNPIVEFS